MNDPRQPAPGPREVDGFIVARYVPAPEVTPARRAWRRRCAIESARWAALAERLGEDG
jgi:hypothetical protein